MTFNPIRIFNGISERLGGSAIEVIEKKGAQQLTHAAESAVPTLTAARDYLDVATQGQPVSFPKFMNSWARVATAETQKPVSLPKESITFRQRLENWGFPLPTIANAKPEAPVSTPAIIHLPAHASALPVTKPPVASAPEGVAQNLLPPADSPAVEMPAGAVKKPIIIPPKEVTTEGKPPLKDWLATKIKEATTTTAANGRPGRTRTSALPEEKIQGFIKEWQSIGNEGSVVPPAERKIPAPSQQHINLANRIKRETKTTAGLEREQQIQAAADKGIEAGRQAAAHKKVSAEQNRAFKSFDHEMQRGLAAGAGTSLKLSPKQMVERYGLDNLATVLQRPVDSETAQGELTRQLQNKVQKVISAYRATNPVGTNPPGDRGLGLQEQVIHGLARITG